MPQVSQRMPRISQGMARVSHAMARVSQRLGFSDLEQDFFRAGDAMSAGDTMRDEHDHDAWRQPARKFSLRRSMLALVTFPAAVVRHFTQPREEVDVSVGSLVRSITGSVQRMTTGAIQRMTGQLPVDKR